MKKLFFIFLFIFVCSNCFSAEVIADKPVIEATQDYWVYVRLEDRSGVTAEDDIGRSKRGDIVGIVKADGTNIPSTIAKDEWLIYKASLTKAQKHAMIEPMIEEDGIDYDGNIKYKTIAYRKTN